MTYPRFLTPEHAGQAFEDFTLPVIERGLKDGYCGGTYLYLLTLNPCVPYSVGAPLPILFEWYSSDKAAWPDWDGKKFDDFAKAKAMISWQTGKSSKEVALMWPHLLQPGNTSLWGSDVSHGFITAASGVKPNFDEMFSRVNNAVMIAEATLHAERFAKQRDKPDWL